MKMILFNMIGALSLVASVSSAGPRSSGGGFVIACPETPVSAASVQLLDIYEIENQHTVVPVTGDLKKEYVDAVGRLNARLGAPNYVQENGEAIQKNLTRFFQSIVWVDQADNLPIADDLGKKPWIPSQCQIRQMAYFDDASQRIYVNRELFQKLNTRDQAALVLHELFFHEFRYLGESTSQSSRRLTGLAFVSSALDPVFPMPIPEDKMLTFSDAKFPEPVSGRTAYTEVAFFKSVGVEKSVLIFKTLLGRPVLTYTRAVLSPIDVEFENKWVDTPPYARVVRVIKTPNLKIDQQVPVEGQSFGDLGYEIRIHGETGSALYLDLIQNGVVLQSAYLTP